MAERIYPPFLIIPESDNWPFYFGFVYFALQDTSRVFTWLSSQSLLAGDAGAWKPFKVLMFPGYCVNSVLEDPGFKFSPSLEACGMTLVSHHLSALPMGLL